VSIPLPKTDSVRYDLFRGGIAAEAIEAGPGKPLLVVERKSRIAKLTVDEGLQIRLVDDAGAPVDLSVVRVEVFDPGGRVVRHYSSNVTVRDGRAAFHIPFAISDSAGRWRVRARDVISGLVVENVVMR
jgi:hypothetical protein